MDYLSTPETEVKGRLEVAMYGALSNEVELRAVPSDEAILHRMLDELAAAGADGCYLPLLGDRWTRVTEVRMGIRSKVRHLCRRLEDIGLVELAHTDQAPDTMYRQLTPEGEHSHKSGTAAHMVFWPLYTYERVREAVVHMELTNTDGDVGSATAVHLGGGWLLTCAHCLRYIEAAAVRCTPSDGNALGVDLAAVRVDVSTDSAIVCVQGLAGVPELHVDCRPAAVLDEVLVLHYPSVPLRLPALVVSRGEVNGILSDFKEGTQYLLISTKTARGSSGGAVVGTRGMLVGLVSEQTSRSASSDEAGGHDDVFYHAVPALAAWKALERGVSLADAWPDD